MGGGGIDWIDAFDDTDEWAECREELCAIVGWIGTGLKVALTGVEGPNPLVLLLVLLLLLSSPNLKGAILPLFMKGAFGAGRSATIVCGGIKNVLEELDWSRYHEERFAAFATAGEGRDLPRKESVPVVGSSKLSSKGVLLFGRLSERLLS
jgi:hypothetical protein